MDESNINTKTLLPSESDYEQLTRNFSHHVARVLKEYMPFFSSFGSGLERHIRHQYYEEMSQKSEVVSCVCHVYIHLFYNIIMDVIVLRRASDRSACPLHCPSGNPPLIINQLLVVLIKRMLSTYPALLA